MATYPDYVDYSTFRSPDGTPDLDPNWTPISGSRSVVEKVFRRWFTPKGEMDDPDYGYPVARYYNAAMLPIEKEALRSGLRAEALKVEGVADCVVFVDVEDGVAAISGELTLDDQQTWRFVFSLSPDNLSLITLLGPEDPS